MADISERGYWNLPKQRDTPKEVCIQFGNCTKCGHIRCCLRVFFRPMSHGNGPFSPQCLHGKQTQHGIYSLQSTIPTTNYSFYEAIMFLSTIYHFRIRLRRVCHYLFNAGGTGRILIIIHIGIHLIAGSLQICISDSNARCTRSPSENNVWGVALIILSAPKSEPFRCYMGLCVS